MHSHDVRNEFRWDFFMSLSLLGVVHKWRQSIFDNFWHPLSPSLCILVLRLYYCCHKTLETPSLLRLDVFYGRLLTLPCVPLSILPRGWGWGLHFWSLNNLKYQVPSLKHKIGSKQCYSWFSSSRLVEILNFETENNKELLLSLQLCSLYFSDLKNNILNSLFPIILNLTHILVLKHILTQWLSN
jgi:hypothetical protein